MENNDKRHGSFAMVSADQLVITGGTFVQNINNHHHTPFNILTDAVAHSAFHNAEEQFNAPKCHENTRVAVLKKIMDWITGQDPETRDHYIMWLTGAAGAGKSAIAHKIVELCIQSGVLVASFFFNRSDGTRNDEKRLISTLAYQLSSSVPAAKVAILREIAEDPLVFKKGLDHQFNSLIAKPLHSEDVCELNEPRVLIIDGLDECIDRDKQVQILKIVRKATEQVNLPIHFLIASRPEHEIKAVFNSQSMRNILTRLVLDDTYRPDEDIERFLRDNFNKIKKDHPFKDCIPQPWPTDDDIHEVVQKSSGQFIYAATVIRYVESLRHMPDQRLSTAIGLTPAKGDLPFAELDCLYRTILSSVENINEVLMIFGLCVTSSRVPSLDILLSSTINLIFSLSTGELQLLLCDLSSLVSLSYAGIEFLHASLHDFLFDPARSKEYFIDVAIHNPTILRKIMDAIYLHKSTELFVSSHSLHDLIILFGVYSENVYLSDDVINAIDGFGLEDVLRSIWEKADHHYLPKTAVETFILSFLRVLKKISQENTHLLHIEQKHQHILDSFYLSLMISNDSVMNYQTYATLQIISVAGEDSLIPITRVLTQKPAPDYWSHFASWEDESAASDYLTLSILTFQNIFHLDLHYKPGNSADLYRRHIIEFLHDPSRSGKYYIGPKRNALAALSCIRQLLDMTGSVYPKSTTIPNIYSHVFSPVEGPKWRAEVREYVPQHVIYLLSGYVLYFLPRAARNLALIDECRLFQTGAWSRSMDNYPQDRYLLVRKAMGTYLQRMGHPVDVPGEA